MKISLFKTIKIHYNKILYSNIHTKDMIAKDEKINPLLQRIYSK